MTERSFRLVIGVWLLVSLWVPLPSAIHALMVILLVEGLTNWRIPAAVSRLRGMTTADGCTGDDSAIPFEAERALRLLIVAFLAIALFALPNLLWWLPWFIGFALVGAGLSGICPMVQVLRWTGMR